MKAVVGSIGLIWMVFFFGVIALSLYGLVVAFKVSILLGIAALVLEPAPFIIGLLMFFGDVNLPQKIAEWLGL